ncbi:MAG: TrmH family RNA methyltransferase [Bacteroidia bacterium]
MLSKNQIKFVNSLKQKKFRDEHGYFIAEGTKIVPELLSSEIEVLQVYAGEWFISGHAIGKGVECIEIKPSELERISALSTPNEVLAVCRIPEYQLERKKLEKKLTIVLDDIRDPGNLGTIIRIADWFGITDVICSNASADAFNPKVVQSSMGSIARVKIHYTDLAEFLSDAETTVYGALLEGKNIYSEKLSSEGMIVIGNESKGISEAVQKFVTHKISIPSFSHFKPGGGEAESLNAAVATAVICSEFRRR